MDEHARLEFDRQQEADQRNHEQYCANCGTLAPGGGYCAGCRVMLSAAENGGGSASPVMELTVNDVIADAFKAESQADDARERRADGDWFERTRRYCPNCSGESPSGGFCSGCMFFLQLETGEGSVEPTDAGDAPLAYSPEAPPSAEYGHDPELDFVDPRYGVDMEEIEGASGETALGYPRDSRQFWDVLLERSPELFSEKNVDFINRGLAPEVDEEWLKLHPGQEMYLGDRLVHHHWDQGPIAFGIPEHFHTEFNELLHPLRYPE